LAQRVPSIISQFKTEGQTVPVITLKQMNMKTIMFPKENTKSVVVFWATWCAPCSVELNRINSAILNKEIDAKDIYAINTGEDPSLVTKELNKKHYVFKSYFDIDNKLANFLNSNVTPTIAFIDKNQKIQWISSGISPSLIYRIKNFLSN
jgi:thiol-disulfide isomerase/thioredoxin